nr:reverse transcriptase domain-containing protein [Tanacetum cinerariifolium]
MAATAAATSTPRTTIRVFVVLLTTSRVWVRWVMRDGDDEDGGEVGWRWLRSVEVVMVTSIDVIDEILVEDALFDEGSKILHSIEGTIIKEKLLAEFDEFNAMTAEENSKSESDTEEPPFEKITFNTDYKIKTYLEEPPTDLELKPLPDNLEYAFLEEPSFLHVIISSQLYEENKNKLVFVLKNNKQAFAWKTTDILGIIKEKKGTKNIAADHLSRIKNDETDDDSDVDDNFPGETLMEITTKDEPWFADFANYLSGDVIPKGMTYQQKKFFSDLKNYFWKYPYLFKYSFRVEINVDPIFSKDPMEKS